jgi:hypothetical protein
MLFFSQFALTFQFGNFLGSYIKKKKDISVRPKKFEMRKDDHLLRNRPPYEKEEDKDPSELSRQRITKKTDLPVLLVAAWHDDVDFHANKVSLLWRPGAFPPIEPERLFVSRSDDTALH